ncbi:MAG: peptidylprolyl isomerase [Betaproteobacteria bacterium]|nr:peptidylprolyl isomerase [Betaproteobacteria bacterium]
MNAFPNPARIVRAALCAAAGALLLHSGSAASAESAAGRQLIAPVDRIVAIVNDEVITRFELDDHVQAAKRQLQKQGTPPPPTDVLEKQMLERMITERVLLRYARETGLRVDDTQLDRALRRIAEENRLTLEGLRQALEREGISFRKFREEIRDEIVMARLKEREVDNRITVTDAEIDQFLASQEAQSGASEEYSLAHILVRVPEQASAEQIQERRRRAEEALSRIRAGADFAQVAAGFSDAPDALQGGVLDFRPAARLPAIFVEALATLKPGEASTILRSPNGFHILKLLAKRGKDVTTVVNQTRARHILVRTSEIVSETDARNRLLQLRERLVHGGADFGELARLHSDDPSASKGGELGWISPGDTVPEFERAMDALKPGELGDPVQTPFGWHLIQVLERRTQDVTKDRQRLLARQALRARKSDEAYQEWVRQQRDRAYVEYRLEER